MIRKKIKDTRREYRSGVLCEEGLPGDPVLLFDTWMKEALENGIVEPNAMFLATAGHDGKPSGRIVLLRDYSQEGFVFYTNYRSRKGKELEENPGAALTFFWPELERQIRITGSVKKTTRKESDDYFQSRPPASRLSALISPQSSVIPDRDYLEMKRMAFTSSGMTDQPPRPSHWGGYRLYPDTIEFWQGREFRLHDRIQYRKQKKVWIVERLAP